MPAPKILTEVGIRSAISAVKKTGRERWVSDGLIPRTHGGLQLRVKPAACFWYFRYTDAQGKKQRSDYSRFAANSRSTMTTSRHWPSSWPCFS